MDGLNKKHIIGGALAGILLICFAGFAYGLAPPGSANGSHPVLFEIKKGDGSRTVLQHLGDTGLIRSRFAFEIFSFFGGKIFSFKPGLYRLDPSMSAPEILGVITAGNAGTVTVRIPDGAAIYQVDSILADALVIHPGDLIALGAAQHLEGMLFPDTYNFYTNGNVSDVVRKLTDNFRSKTASLFPKDPSRAAEDLVVASLIEKEVPDAQDQKIVSGIIWKRLSAGVPLNVDAAICYAKAVQQYALGTGLGKTCYPLTPLDYAIDSPYNTYLHKGLPPGPIGSPGIQAITAALNPVSSPYWYYLSDPATGKTIFATTLDEQNRNRVKYLVR